MSVVKIKKNPYGDTRTAPKDVTPAKIRIASYEHIESVREVFMLLSAKMAAQAQLHDFTKVDDNSEIFHSDFMSTMRKGTNFVDGDWYKHHVRTERHHPTNSNHRDDINLFDILEMIVDAATAGTARSGKIFYPKLSPEVYEKAVENTKRYVESLVEAE